MIRSINHDTLFLSQKSETVVRQDLPIATDLLETLAAHQAECVGIAANMIGVRKSIIAVNLGFANIAMMNPVIVKKSSPYTVEEGCLSLAGKRKAQRWRVITVEYRDLQWELQRQEFQDFPAQIIQHEIDHCNGILI